MSIENERNSLLNSYKSRWISRQLEIKETPWQICCIITQIEFHLRALSSRFGIPDKLFIMDFFSTRSWSPRIWSSSVSSPNHRYLTHVPNFKLNFFLWGKSNPVNRKPHIERRHSESFPDRGEFGSRGQQRGLCYWDSMTTHAEFLSHIHAPRSHRSSKMHSFCLNIAPPKLKTLSSFFPVTKTMTVTVHTMGLPRGPVETLYPLSRIPGSISGFRNILFSTVDG